MSGKWRYLNVDWHDAHSTADWVALEDLPEPVIITTRGWLVKESSGYIVVAASFQHLEEDLVGEVIAIPRGCILSLEEI